MFAYVIYW